MRRPQRVWAKKDWETRLRFFNVNNSKPERCGVFMRRLLYV
jgi:hypothetical protein